MDVTEALKTRISTRAFMDKPVSEEKVREILEIARWAPSGGNLQPWRVHVVMESARNRLIAQVKQELANNPMEDDSELAIYPPKLAEPWRSRRYKMGEDMYALLNIPKTDKMSRFAWLARNFEFFGAPVGLFFSLDRRFDKNQWAHLGMLMQSIALVATQKGLATCMQEAWQRQAKLVSTFLNLDEREQFYCGMALGYCAQDAPVNKLRSDREPIDAFTVFLK